MSSRNIVGPWETFLFFPLAWKISFLFQNMEAEESQCSWGFERRKSTNVEVIEDLEVIAPKAGHRSQELCKKYSGTFLRRPRAAYTGC